MIGALGARRSLWVYSVGGGVTEPELCTRMGVCLVTCAAQCRLLREQDTADKRTK